MNKSDKLICLNPNCPLPALRIFHQEELINEHKKCLNWIINSPVIIQQNMQSHTLSSEKLIQFNSSGLNSIYQVLQLKNWPYQLNAIFQDLKNRVIQEIENIKNQKILEFQRVYSQAEHAYLEIQEISNKIYYQNKDQGGNIQDPKNLWGFLKGQSICLYQISKATCLFESKIMQNLKKIGNFLQTIGPNLNIVAQFNNKSGYQKAKQYLQNNSIAANEKLQRIANVLGKEIFKSAYDSKLSLYKTKCIICDTICLAPKQDSTKVGCLQQLLHHIRTSHQNQLLNNLNRVMKFDVKEISYASFIEKVSYQYFEQIWIIDRENAGSTEKPLKIGQNKLWIEVVNKDNKNLAKDMYIVAQSNRKDAADILIITLIYEICKHQTQKIMLITKDHFGITLQEIINKEFGNKMVCIEPKNFSLALTNIPLQQA